MPLRIPLQLSTKRSNTPCSPLSPASTYQYELGRQTANTKLSSNKTVRRILVHGGNVEWRALRLNTSNFSWGSEAVTRKTRIIEVAYNASNNELVRTKKLVKGAVVEVDAAAFRQWGGVLKFYCGKSKSFTSLEDMVSSCSSIKDLAKPENPYSRKRKNLIAFSNTWDRTRPLDDSRSIEGGISKRHANYSGNNLYRTASTSSSGSNNHNSEGEHETPRVLPPLHPRSRPPDAATPVGFSSQFKDAYCS